MIKKILWLTSLTFSQACFANRYYTDATQDGGGGGFFSSIIFCILVIAAVCAFIDIFSNFLRGIVLFTACLIGLNLVSEYWLQIEAIGLGLTAVFFIWVYSSKLFKKDE